MPPNAALAGLSSMAWHQAPLVDSRLELLLTVVPIVELTCGGGNHQCLSSRLEKLQPALDASPNRGLTNARG